MMRVLFCVPAYGGSVRVETMQSVASGLIQMTQNIPGVEVRLFSIDMAEIARVRNLFASLALQEEYDALVMVDSDMSIPPETFWRLLMSKHEVCGLTYPKREINLERFHELTLAGADVAAATAGALNFIAMNSFVHNEGRIDIQNSYLEMKEIPAGCMVIRRSVLEKMWKALPDIRQTKNIGDLEGTLGLTRIIRCFDNIQDGNTKYSEDISFCKRWVGMGGKVHVLFDVPVGHHGHMKYEGAYSDALMARRIDAKPVA